MIITPYSALDTQAELAASAANFPALKHFFPCGESAGGLTLTDIVGGVVIPTAALTKPDTKCVSAGSGNITATTNATLSAGAWASPGGVDTVVFAVADSAIGSKICAGLDTGDDALFLSSPTIPSSVSDGSTIITATPLTGGGGTVFGVGMMVDFGGNLTSFEAKGDGSVAYSAKAGVSMGALASIPALQAKASLVGISKLYGWAIFQFSSGIPSDMASAITWMTQNWIAGKKAIYPGWKGRT